MELQLDEKFVKDTLEREVISVWVRACETFGIPWNKFPTVSFIENTAKAGSAPMEILKETRVVVSYGVNLNLPLAMESEENYFEFMNQVIPHEICHIIARMFFPMDTDHHGWAWRAVMMKLEKNPDRTHNMDVGDVSGKTFEYKCPDCGQKYFFGKTKHTRVQNGSRRFCGVCKSSHSLVFVKNHEVVQANEF